VEKLQLPLFGSDMVPVSDEVVMFPADLAAYSMIRDSPWPMKDHQPFHELQGKFSFSFCGDMRDCFLR
jgi:hypothetical protein